MSLHEVYRLAHSAECRLNISASRPDRNLRFVVGHLMHYESLRLRIVEIEHDISRSERATAVQFQGTGHVESNHQQLRQKPSTGQLGKRSPPPNNDEHDYDDDDEIDDDGLTDDDDDDDEDEDEDVEIDKDGDDADLGLTRFPSSSSKHPPPLVQDTIEDEVDEENEDEIDLPEDPDSVTIHNALQQPSNDELAQNLNMVRKCSCHRHSDAPAIEHLWMLPNQEGGNSDITRAVAQVSA